MSEGKGGNGTLGWAEQVGEMALWRSWGRRAAGEDANGDAPERRGPHSRRERFLSTDGGCGSDGGVGRCQEGLCGLQ